MQAWRPNPQLIQHSQQAQPPQGWSTTWPLDATAAFPPGYPVAGPHPIPGGSAPSSHWNAGYWQYDPHTSMQNSQQPWELGAGWVPPKPNARKRVPRRPSPGYWNTKLSDNGLGLEGMVPRRDPSKYDGEEPHTPMVWNPPSLLEGGDRAVPVRDFDLRRIELTNNTTTHHGQRNRRPLQERFSSSYWDTKLTDNGLGLEGMVKRKDPPEHHDDVQTPWIWNPPSLLKGDDHMTPIPESYRRGTGFVDSTIHNVRVPIDPSGTRSTQVTGGFVVPSLLPPQTIPSVHFASAQQATSIRTRESSSQNAGGFISVPLAPPQTIPGSLSASAQQIMFVPAHESSTPSAEPHQRFSPSILRTREAYRSPDTLSSSDRSSIMSHDLLLPALSSAEFHLVPLGRSSYWTSPDSWSGSSITSPRPNGHPSASPYHDRYPW